MIDSSLDNPPLASAAEPVHSARQDALDWLLGRINYERTAAIPYHQRQLKLDRMRQLLTRLGQPDAGLRIVHVAGTKGKGSTAAMIAGILTAAGFRTGLFSSPHLESIEERFAVDGRACEPEQLVALVARLRPVVEAMDVEAAAEGDPVGGPTFFEVTTALALLYFVARRVDAAVLEVGLGGRLDSTNVCLPSVSVITNISFDHTKQLGSTLAAIAREKAGIVKPGVPVVSGVIGAEPQSVVADVAREHGCRLIQLGREFHAAYEPPRRRQRASQPADSEPVTAAGGRIVGHIDSSAKAGRLRFQLSAAGQELTLDNVTLAMRGEHQAMNAAVALAVAAELRHQGWQISPEAMRLGLSTTALPGRVEFWEGEPTIVLDAAHNPASARALARALGELPTFRRRTVVLSISHDKDAEAILRELVPAFDRFIVTQYQDNPRAIPAERLAKLVRDAINRMCGQGAADATAVEIVVKPTDAWSLVTRTALAGELVCVTGSFFLVAEMRPIVAAARTPHHAVSH